MSLCYAGIGSRDTPARAQMLLRALAKRLADKGYTLRSGGAPGADRAFESGADEAGGKKEIYLPWPGFESSTSSLVVTNPKAFTIAEQLHPNWDTLKSGARKLLGRNTHQILGPDLDDYSKFVVCWTKDGKGGGGTGQAIRVARHFNVPVVDVGQFDFLEDKEMVKQTKELLRHYCK